VTPFFHALWLLCAVGSVIFAAQGTKRSILGLAVGFAAAASWVHPGRLPDVAWIAGVTALAAGLTLFRPALVDLGAVWGGALAGILVSLLRVEGIPAVPALILSAALPSVSAFLALRRSDFAPKAMREEALLLLLALGAGAAMAPQIVAGWQSAGSLNVGPGQNAANSMPAWVLLLGGMSVALGGLFSLWRHR
jgi:hypothetical protein